MRYFVTALSLVGLIVSSAFGDCTPEKVVHLVIHTESPAGATFQFRQTSTLYRLGASHLRIEFGPRQKRGSGVLVVIAEPDVWAVNVRDRTGEHAVDHGPTFHAHVRVFAYVESGQWRDFEYGCETEFMTRLGVELKPVQGTKLFSFTHAAEGKKATLFVDESGIPKMIDIVDREVAFRVVYDTYEFVPSNPALFTKPRWVRYVDKN